jgi:hypothetical protein
LRLSSISSVSIGAFTAAIVASYPDNLIAYFVLEGFDRLYSKPLTAQVERFFAYFGALFDRVDRLGVKV